jgi:hypothetical protein
MEVVPRACFVSFKNAVKKGNKIRKDSTKHYPNANEAKLLRRIMSETGLTEEEIRSSYKYRKQLSDAQKEGNKPIRSDAEKWCHMIIKDACKETRLPKEHPKTIEVIDRLLNERRNDQRFRRMFLFSWSGPENAKILLRDYGKTYKK